MTFHQPVSNSKDMKQFFGHVYRPVAEAGNCIEEHTDCYRNLSLLWPFLSSFGKIIQIVKSLQEKAHWTLTNLPVSNLQRPVTVRNYIYIKENVYTCTMTLAMQFSSVKRY